MEDTDTGIEGEGWRTNELSVHCAKALANWGMMAGWLDECTALTHLIMANGTKTKYSLNYVLCEKAKESTTRYLNCNFTSY